MKCLYCHNPETQNVCNNCGECANSCPSAAITSDLNKTIKHDKKLCLECDKCLESCRRFSSPKYMSISIEELFEKIEDNSDFIDGITTSGGECTMQHEFIYSLFKKIKEEKEITTFIDTNGLFSQEVREKLIPLTDGFMIDLKALDNDKHFKLTGASNELVIKNIEAISNAGILYEIRTVLVEGFTDTVEEIKAISNFITKLNNYTKLKLIRFRPMGVRTYLNQYPSTNIKHFEKLCSVSYEILGERLQGI